MFFDVSDKLDLIKCKIEWKIYDLKLRKEFLGEKHMTSKNFYNPKCPSVVWELRVYQYLNCASTYVSLTQTGLKESKVNLCAKYNIYAYDIVGKLVNICSILLYCEVEFVPYNIKCENNQISINQIEKRNLLEDLFLDRTLSDFVIKIGDEKINVHRCILAQNSNVFLTMFKQKDMIEAKNVLITVKSR
uniref:BTB domain-containing protein n=1 Tax=Meloidogyne javanica TaxID=6303 RepID=A0A915MR87_MELJA